MRFTLLLMMISLSLASYSQNAALTQSPWYFTQLEQGTTITTQPVLFRGVGTTITFNTSTSFETYAYNDISGDITFVANNTEFIFNFGVATLSFANDPVIDGFDQEYTQFFLPYQGQTFTYSIVTLGNITTLRITNPAGKIAVYQNVPLSEASFQLSSTEIFLSPDGNKITIDPKDNSLNLLGFELFDLSGKRIAKSQNLENAQMDISYLQNGFCILKLLSKDGNSKTFKFSK